MEGIFSKKKENEEDSSLFDFIPVSNPAVGILVKLIKQRFLNKEKNSKADATPGQEKKRGKNPLKAIAFEFIGGYLKWKAIELSYKGIRYLLKKRKEGKADN